MSARSPATLPDAPTTFSTMTGIPVRRIVRENARYDVRCGTCGKAQRERLRLHFASDGIGALAKPVSAPLEAASSDRPLPIDRLRAFAAPANRAGDWPNGNLARVARLAP